MLRECLDCGGGVKRGVLSAAGGGLRSACPSTLSGFAWLTAPPSGEREFTRETALFQLCEVLVVVDRAERSRSPESRQVHGGQSWRRRGRCVSSVRLLKVAAGVEGEELMGA